MSSIVSVYADGGVILRNPSPHGGTWAWCHVAQPAVVIASACGVLEGNGITNNQSEFAAAVSALEALPAKWSGKLYSDSQVTLGRLCWRWSLNGISPEWLARGSQALARLGRIEPVLLQGHPTKADLVAGVGSKRGLPVSEFNVKCDEQCQKLAREFLARLSRND